MSEVDSTETYGAEEGLTFEEILATIQRSVSEVEAYSDPTIKRVVFELLDHIDMLHREGLTRIASGLRGVNMLDRAMDDPMVAHLFAIYDLLEDVDVDEAVEAALAEARTYTHSHGGEIELVEIAGGVVHLRMMGACDDCPSAAVTLTQRVEESIRERWPGFVRVEVDGPAPVHAAPTQAWQSLDISVSRRGSH